MRSGQIATIFGTLALIVASASVLAQGSKVDPALRADTRLRNYGIELTRPSLNNALESDNPRIRALAAYQLVNTEGKDAVPIVKSAFASEINVLTRVEFAVAMAAARDVDGIEHLKAFCADSTLPLSGIDQATESLQALHLPSGHCADAVLSALPQPGDGEPRAIALTLLPTIYAQVSQEQKDRIVIAIEEMLGDNQQEPSVRLCAGQALVQIGLPSLIDVIRDALPLEGDPTIRSSFEQDLKILGSKNEPIKP